MMVNLYRINELVRAAASVQCVADHLYVLTATSGEAIEIEVAMPSYFGNGRDGAVTLRGQNGEMTIENLSRDDAWGVESGLLNGTRIKPGANLNADVEAALASMDAFLRQLNNR